MSVKTQEDKKSPAFPWTARQRRGKESRKSRKMSRTRYTPMAKAVRPVAAK